ncbi:hypothetical protein RUND412_005675 [Rhizina undulata]
MSDWIRVLPRAAASESSSAGLSVVDYAQTTGREEYIFGTTSIAGLDYDYDRRFRGEVVVITAILFLAITLLPVAGKILQRRQSERLNLEEGILIPAICLTVVLSIVGCVAVQLGGLGKHIFDVTVDELSILLKLNFTHVALNKFSVALAEISILCYYRRKLSPAPWMQKTINALLILTPLYAFSVVLGLSLMCTADPSASYNGEKILSGTCSMESTRIATALLVTSTFGFILDSGVWALGALLVWRLPIFRERRLLMMVTLGIAFVGCITEGLNIGVTVQLTSNMDLSYNLAYLFVVNQLQADFFVITCCILPLIPIPETPDIDTILDKSSLASLASSSLNCFGSVPRSETEESLARPSMALSGLHMVSQEPDGTYQVTAEACGNKEVSVPIRCALRNMWKERGHNRQQLSSSSQEILKTSTVEVCIENLRREA